MIKRSLPVKYGTPTQDTEEFEIRAEKSKSGKTIKVKTLNPPILFRSRRVIFCVFSTPGGELEVVQERYQFNSREREQKGGEQTRPNRPPQTAPRRKAQ